MLYEREYFFLPLLSLDRIIARIKFEIVSRVPQWWWLSRRAALSSFSGYFAREAIKPPLGSTLTRVILFTKNPLHDRVLFQGGPYSSSASFRVEIPENCRSKFVISRTIFGRKFEESFIAISTAIIRNYSLVDALPIRDCVNRYEIVNTFRLFNKTRVYLDDGVDQFIWRVDTLYIRGRRE